VLHVFLRSNRAEIIDRARAKVAARAAPRASEDELTNGIPFFLDQLIETLRLSQVSSEAAGENATERGRDLLKGGFTVAQVVHDYVDICEAITELAGATTGSMRLTAAEFHTLNRCLDDAIAQTVTEYTRQREQSIAEEGREILGDLSHELRNALGAALLSFQTLKTGRVGLGGSTSALLGRSLRRLAALIDSSVAQVRLDSGLRTLERVSLREFVEEVEVGASLEASARGLTLSVASVEPGVDVEVDRQLLAAAVANLLQNAFKFTRPESHVWLNTSAIDERVLIDVQDQCGGLPPGKVDELFRPFEQRSANRAGLGLGLSISRRSVHANGGEIRVRDIPGSGCVFTIDLPRLSP
jgi:signal transduction histidine kinase